jgi:hypothetical protein
METIQLKSTEDILVGTQTDLGENFKDFPYVFKYEYKHGGKMLVVCFRHEKDILPYMKQYPPYWYDCARTDRPVREFYDIDLKREELPQGEFKTDEEITEYVVETLLKVRDEIVDTTEGLISGITPRKDFMIMTAHNENKISIHIINETRHFQSIKVQGDFTRHIHTRLEELNSFFNIDTSVYSNNRCFRMLNQTKHGHNRPLRWFNRTMGGMLDASIVLLSKESKLIEWIVEEKEESKIEEYITTDLRGLDEFLRTYPYFELDGKRLNRILPSKCLCDETDFHSKENMYIVSNESGVFVRCFCGKGQPILIEKRQMKPVELKPQKLKYSTMERHRMEQEEYERILLENDMIIDCRMTGSGKTTNFMKFLETKRKLNVNISSLILHHRQSLDEDYKRKYGDNKDIRLKSYKDDAKHLKKDDVLSCVINSLYSTLRIQLEKNFHDYDYICIDEIGSLLKQTSMDDMYFNIGELFDILTYYEKPLVLLDANLNDDYIEFILSLRREKRREFKCQVITPDFTQLKKIPLMFYEGSIDDFITEKLVPHDFKKSKVILPSSLSIERTKKYLQYLKLKIPSLSYIYIHKDSRKKYTEEGILKTEELLKYDMIVYSPTISEGVSFDSEEFKDHIGFSLLCNTSASPFSANQMQKRFRCLKKMYVCYEPIQYNPKFETEEDYCKYLQGSLSELKKLTLQKILNNGRHDYKLIKDDFYKLSWLNKYNDEYFKEKTRFKNVFLQLAVNNGYDISFGDIQTEITEQDKEIVEEIGEKLQEEQLKQLMSLPLITKEYYDKIKNINTEENTILKLKYNIFFASCPNEIHQPPRDYPIEFYKYWFNRERRHQILNLRRMMTLERVDNSITLTSCMEQTAKRIYDNFYGVKDYREQQQLIFKHQTPKLYVMESICQKLGFKQLPDFQCVPYQPHSFQLTPSLFRRLDKLFLFKQQSPLKQLTEKDGQLVMKTYFFPTTYDQFLHLNDNIKLLMINRFMEKMTGIVLYIKSCEENKTIQMKTTLDITLSRDDKPHGYLTSYHITDNLYEESKDFFSMKYYCDICEEELTYSPSSSKHTTSKKHREKCGLEQYTKCSFCKERFLSSVYDTHICNPKEDTKKTCKKCEMEHNDYKHKCKKQKVEYKCEKCHKTYTDKSIYTRHINRKYPCVY